MIVYYLLPLLLGMGEVVFEKTLNLVALNIYGLKIYCVSLSVEADFVEWSSTCLLAFSL